MGIEADDGINIVFEQCRHYNISGFSNTDRPAGLNVQQLHKMSVFHDVEPVLVSALRRNNAGIANAIPIIDRTISPGFR